MIRGSSMGSDEISDSCAKSYGGTDSLKLADQSILQQRQPVGRKRSGVDCVDDFLIVSQEEWN